MRLAIAAIGGIIGTALLAGSAFAQPGNNAEQGGVQPAAQNAKLTEAQAAEIALKAQPGTITDKELEKERGGSGLRYSFDIAKNGKTHEVGVDAESGKLLENSIEGPNPD